MARLSQNANVFSEPLNTRNTLPKRGELTIILKTLKKSTKRASQERNIKIETSFKMIGKQLYYAYFHILDICSLRIIILV